MRRAPTFSFIFFNDSIFERLREEELNQEQQQPQHWQEWEQKEEQEQKLTNDSASFSVAS
jgi:hypothetical protein